MTKRQKMKTKVLKSEIKLNNKRYEYTLKDKGGGIVSLECPAAKIAQDFLKEDIAAAIIDLPDLILAEKEYSNKASEVIQFRVTPTLKKKIEKISLDNGFDSISSYLRNNFQTA